MRKLAGAALAVWILGVTAAPTHAASIVATLGDVDFTDNTTVSSVDLDNADDPPDPSPFDGTFCGSDNGANCVTSWTFNYAPIAEVILSATLEFGITDHDTAATGNQFANFNVDGTDLTGTLNILAEADNTASNNYQIYSLVLPGSLFAALADGSATVNFATTGPGLGVLVNGPTLPFNGVGLDFSRLTIQTISDVPEPSTIFLSLAGFAALGLAKFRRRG